MMREGKEQRIPVKCMTDEEIASAIRDLDPYPGSEQSGDDGTVLVTWFGVLILLIGVLTIVWLYLRKF